VEAAENYARRLERDLQQTKAAAHQYQVALTECEASLVTSWETLNKERLDHRASREALAFESERHKETMELLERMFKEAIRSSEVADNLSSRLAAQHTGPNLEVCQAVPKLEGFSDQRELNRGKAHPPLSANEASR
jgi:hypothetical protein